MIFISFQTKKSLYICKKSFKMSSFYKLSIKEVRRETPEAVSILFNIPEELKSHYKFVAGQYVTIKLTLDGKEIRRAYSICSAPNSGELRVAVKAVKNGAFSQLANTVLKSGDILEVSNPEGNFVFEPKQDRQRNYAAFTAGSGITPVLSIIQTILNEEPNSTFVLVYGNKTPEHTIFHNALLELQSKYVGRFFVQFVYSQTKIEGEIFGRIEKSTVNFILNNKYKTVEFSKFYLCGPEEMINVVSATLKEHNVSEKNIKFELFTSSSVENEVAISENGHSKITVILDDEETTFDMSQQQNILDASLKHGLDAPYSCQGGICSSCLAKVTKGSAEMKKNSILTEKEVANGLILTCQAHPTSEEITIDFDDV